MSNVLEQALEALESLQEEKRDYMVRNNLGDPTKETNYKLSVTAIAALKEAIAKQGEPVAIVKHQVGGVAVHILGDLKPGDLLYTSAPTIPEGWRLVPIEPTPEMINAACDCQDADPEDGCESETYHGYKAMLSAAPKGAQP